jgi:hypothetical protein
MHLGDKRDGEAEMLKMVFAAVAFLALVAVVELARCGQSFAQPILVELARLPEACIGVGDENWRPLPEQDSPDIIFSTKVFRHGTKEYVLKTFSAQAKHPIAKDTFCLRYEIENAGPGNVRHLLWRLPRDVMRIDTLPPSDVRAIVYREAARAVIRKESIIEAFENVRIATDVWEAARAR